MVSNPAGTTSMVKKIRYQEDRNNQKRGQKPPDRWIFEPLDWALVAAIALIVLWLQWLMGVLNA